MRIGIYSGGKPGTPAPGTYKPVDMQGLSEIGISSNLFHVEQS